MSGAVLVQNYFSRVAYTGHTLAADEEASGHEAFRIATGRRSPFTNYFESITANAQRTLTVTCNVVRTANGFALDRGHNLAGKQVVLECSDDNFTTTQTAFDIVLPTSAGAGSLDDSLGVSTAEGAWLKRFTARSALYWRIRIPALGAGVKPKIVGAMLGNWYAIDPIRPMAADQDELVIDESVSDAGWRGAGPIATVAMDTLHIKLTSLFEYDIAAQHISHFAKRRPMWIVLDDAQADTAKMAIRPAGVMGFTREIEWFYHQVSLSWVEHEPLRT